VPDSTGGGRSIDDILMPGGRPIGVRGSGPRASARLREVTAGQAKAERIVQDLTQGDKDITPAGYPGTLIELPNGRGTVGYRPVSRSGAPTIDVKAGDASGQPIPVRKIEFVDGEGPRMTPDEVLQGLLDECHRDHVGLWEIANAARFDLGAKSPAETQARMLQIVRGLLDERGVQVGHPTPDGRGFVAWGLPPDEAVRRIEQEWSALGREPGIGEVAWFTSAPAPPNAL
jgi:hypothetical protein